MPKHTLGVTALITTLAVRFGFRVEFLDTILGANAHGESNQVAKRDFRTRLFISDLIMSLRKFNPSQSTCGLFALSIGLSIGHNFHDLRFPIVLHLNTQICHFKLLHCPMLLKPPSKTKRAVSIVLENVQPAVEGNLPACVRDDVAGMRCAGFIKLPGEIYSCRAAGPNNLVQKLALLGDVPVIGGCD
jgi:hypothetical protein